MSTHLSGLWRVAALTLSLVFVAPAARAYESAVHERVTRQALVGLGTLATEPVAAAPRGALDAFRRWFYSQAATVADTALRARFLARYPDIRAFDAIAFRELLGFTTAPYRRVEGIDALRSPAGATALDLLANASAAPEVDLRHRDRLVYAGSNKPVEASSGAVTPYDPADTNLGPASGAASDAYAFTTLPEGTSVDEAALATTPSRYAAPVRFPGPIVGRAPEFASTELDLARVASAWPSGASRALVLTHLGAAMHYVQKAASPLWSVQLGSADLLDAARSQYRWRAFVTGGGTLSLLRPDGLIAESFQRNHRRFLDRRIAERLLAGQVIPTDQPFVPAAKAVAATGGEYVSALVRSAAGSAAEDAAAVFSAAVAATCGRMRVEGFVFHDPRAEAALASTSIVCGDATLSDQLATIDLAGDRSLSRATAYTRALYDAATGTLGPDASASAVSRLVKHGLDAMDSAAANRQSWIDAGAPIEGVVRPAWAAFDAALVLLVLAICRWLIRRAPSLNLPWPPTAAVSPEPPGSTEAPPA